MVMDALQLTVIAVVVFVFLASTALSVQLTRKYLKTKGRPLLYWSIGLWLFAFGTFLEILFAVGIYSLFLISLYLFVVGILVLSLSLGSMELAHTRKLKIAYWAFAIIATILLLVSLIVAPVQNTTQSPIIQNYVVFGILPLLVVETSSLVTFPASIVLIAMALKSYFNTKNARLLSIVAGVIIVAIAGTLYIVQFPEFLYIAELVGIILLWVGFNS